MNAHTPGPWTAQPIYPFTNGGYYVFVDADQSSIIATVHNRGHKNAAANARLIAAAPEMLAALHATRANSSEMHADICGQIDAAIAKAERGS